MQFVTIVDTLLLFVTVVVVVVDPSPFVTLSVCFFVGLGAGVFEGSGGWPEVKHVGISFTVPNVIPVGHDCGAVPGV